MASTQQTRRITLVLLLALATAALATAACTGPRQAAPTARGADDFVVRDIDPIFRGLVGSESSIRGDAPRLVSGIGLVVGLDGTGSGDIPASTRIRLEEQMTRLGVGTSQGGALGRITPAQLIDSPNTAVVLVQAVVRTALPDGTPFDVRVSAWPGSATTSLEGGRLYTTELRTGRRGPNEPDTPAIAEARGEIFINPFTDDEQLTPPTAGRILSGGRITTGRPLRLVLDNPSHARAREITHAINSRFPRADRSPTAIGRNDEIVELNVPPAYQDDVDTFIQLVRFTRVDPSAKADWARRYAEAMIERPRDADDLSWAMRSLGNAAIPHLRPLYEHPDIGPRIAAIQAGAFLRDPTVRPHIESIIADGPSAFRTSAIALLGDLGVDPRIDAFLRELLDSQDPGIRVAAYEAMLERQDPLILQPDVADAFDLHVVPSDVPTVYITQQDKATIVLFGYELQVAEDAFTAIWGGEFLLTSTPDIPRVEMLYDQPDIDRLVRVDTEPELVQIIRALSRRPTYDSFELGFDMNYSRTVRVLAEMIDSGAIQAEFFPEEDRLRLALLRARDRSPELRPQLIGETPEDRDLLDQPPTDAELAAQAEEAERQRPSLRDRIIRFDNPNDPENRDDDANDNTP